MSTFEWLELALGVLTVVGGVIAWAFSGRIGEIERRMDRAGQKTSDLASRVQGMPTNDDLKSYVQKDTLALTLAPITTALEQIRELQEQLHLEHAAQHREIIAALVRREDARP